jgi:hypothetical protein
MTKERPKQLEPDLWRAADNLRAKSDLIVQRIRYAGPGADLPEIC